MNRIGVVVMVLLASLCTANAATITNEASTQQKKGSMPAGERGSSPKAKPLTGQSANAVIRGAIFGDRRQLLSYLSDRGWRRVICTPALKDTYELFQASLQEELDVLWDLDLNASEYGLTKKEHDDVKACIAEMEKYDDNFKAWEELNKAQGQ
jgi:hypothetical protein